MLTRSNVCSFYFSNQKNKELFSKVLRVLRNIEGKTNEEVLMTAIKELIKESDYLQEVYNAIWKK